MKKGVQQQRKKIAHNVTAFKVPGLPMIQQSQLARVVQIRSELRHAMEQGEMVNAETLQGDLDRELATIRAQLLNNATIEDGPIRLKVRKGRIVIY